MKSLLLTVLVLCGADPPEDLRCLNNDERDGALLYPRLQREAYAALDRRDTAYEQLETREDIQAYQQKCREFFLQQIGELPDRTPLNPQIVGTLDADGFRIEKIIFESQPQHHVTANLYVPDGAGPFPAVVVSSGHYPLSKAADDNQRFGIALAQHGMAAFCFDPVGQGERSQILDATGNPLFSDSTTEHFLIGIGATLVGRNTATYRIWDAMRALDYLTSRSDIDAERLGMTGCSGGGTLTSYVMALDERIACAAPACYLTTFRRLIETIGPQDAEQHIFGQIAFGLDHPDYVLLRAPSPVLISATTGDFFDIAGTWDAYRQASRIYAKLGRPEQVALVEAEGLHGVHAQNLAAIVQWMQRWLLDRDAPVEIGEAALRSEQDLLCTSSGQVLDLPQERSVFDLNAVHAAELSQRRDAADSFGRPEEFRERICTLLGITLPKERRSPEWDDRGRVERENCHVDKLVLHTPAGPLPALTFHPTEPQAAAYLYLQAEGKLGSAAGEIQQLVNKGHVVVSVDLRGQGETSSESPDPLLSDWKTYSLAYLLGRPLIGMQVEDVLTAANFVAYYQTHEPREVHVIGIGRAGLAALHAASLSPELFTSVTLHKTPREWTSMIREPVPTGQLDSVVHGALRVYDLPDLVRLAGDEKVRYAAQP